MTASKDISVVKNYYFPKKIGLAGFEHYTSNLSRYRANHYTYVYLWYV